MPAPAPMTNASAVPIASAARTTRSSTSPDMSRSWCVAAYRRGSEQDPAIGLDRVGPFALIKHLLQCLSNRFVLNRYRDFGIWKDFVFPVKSR